MPKQTYLFLGASSLITQEIASIYAKQGHHILLSGRASDTINGIMQNLKNQGAASVDHIQFNSAECDTHTNFYTKITQIVNEHQSQALHIFVLSAIMPSQSDINKNPQLAVETIEIGFTGLVSVLHHFVPFYETEKKGSITVFGSVAGDRGRLNNYVYGATKSGLECYSSGLRNHLGRFNVHVMLVKPGFMDTPLVQSMKLPPLPVAKPKDVAICVTKSLDKKKNIIYVPWFWRIIMGIIAHIPESIFKKLSF